MKKSQMKNDRRKAGVLAPISVLPGPYEIGDFGDETRRVVRWMARAGIKEWLILPLNPTGYGNSPYQCASAFAGNIYYISPDNMIKEGILQKNELGENDYGSMPDQVDYGRLFKHRRKLLTKGYIHFKAQGGLQQKEYLVFCRKNHAWLDDYAVYMTLKEENGYRPWWQWQKSLANRVKPHFFWYVMTRKNEIEFWKFTQFEFFRQWKDLKKYANDNGIRVIGDMPFYVSADSADVWAHRELFAVDPETGRIEMGAGVPADDCFFADRNWGNPVYRWKAHKDTGYEWFRRRIRINAVLYDGLRIDHVIAMVNYFGIRYGEQKGRWYDGPDTGKNKLSDVIDQEAKKSGLFIIGEDLGNVPPGLREMMLEKGWYGMRVLQFAFTGKYGAMSDHLPYYHRREMAVFTGTHDNPPLKEFMRQQTEEDLQYLKWWTGKSTGEELCWALIEEAYKSPACKVFIPVQDLLGMGAESIIVFGDDYERSWKWRIADTGMLSRELADKLKALAVLTGRYLVQGQEFARYLV